ncbi:MAG: 50S ribosomal protein L21 [Actinobacteria bacterium]|nr:50S ribosomal protein L21 [Actinomycetota bacterium]
MYAIVRCGGRQEKASIDDVLTVDKLSGEVGASVTLPAVLVVDDGKVVSDPSELRTYQVTAEIMGAAAGPKINMIHYKNKTGYRRRLGHRQKYTLVRVTAIAPSKDAPKAAATKAAAPKTAAPKTAAPKAAAPKTAATKPAAPKAGGTRAAAPKAAATKPAAKAPAAKAPAAKAPAAKAPATKAPARSAKKD